MATSAAEFWGGACPTPKSTSAYTGNYTTNADASQTRYGCEIIAEQVDFLAKAKEATVEEPKKRRSK